MIKDINVIKKHLKDSSEIELPYPFEKEVNIKYITLDSLIKEMKSIYH